MISGILNIDKEIGISSSKVVSLVRKALDTKKVGHTGTLDLEASGVLPIVIGKATRVSDFLMDETKEYITEAYFGKKTDTLDYDGEVIASSDKTFNKEELIEQMQNFMGEITQIPPMYSALKVDGKKLYDLARQGIEVERKQRKVTIYDFELIDFDFPHAKFKVICSKGTYIRTLIDDLGVAMGTYAYVRSLCRSRVGEFLITDSIKSQDLLRLDREEILKKIQPADLALTKYDRIDLDEKYLKQATNGMTMKVDEYLTDDLIRVYIANEFIGLGKQNKSSNGYFLKMEKVFYER